MGLTDEELDDVLARAQEIDRAARQGDEWTVELAAVIGAAEEVGLSRQAVQQALAERFIVSASPPAIGSLTWARSADRRLYVAEVLATSEEGILVRFLGGGEHRVDLGELRPWTLLPGQRVGCDWPGWGPWTCTVIAYDSEKGEVELSDGWGSKKTFPVSKIWLAPAKADSRAPRKRTYATLFAAGAVAGALIGSIVTALLM